VGGREEQIFVLSCGKYPIKDETYEIINGSLFFECRWEEKRTRGGRGIIFASVRSSSKNLDKK
jgi:hypothetical protein